MQKIAIIGAGFIGAVHAAACNNSEHLELTAISDINESAGREIAEKYGCKFFKNAEEMLEQCEINIVDICVPTFLHKQNILLAAKYKKHIVCEKPITLTLEDMDEILATVEKANVKFMVAQVLRFWPEYVTIKKMYDDGEFGDIKMVYLNRLAQHPNWTKWHRDPKMGGGGLFDLHLHDIDAALYFFGEVSRVYAVGWESNTGCINHVVSTLTFKNGVNVVVEGAFEMTENYPFTMSMRLVGESKTAEYSMVAGFNLEEVSSSKRNLLVFENGKSPEKVNIDVSKDAYQTQLDYFAKCVENDEMLTIITPQQSREVVKIMLTIMESVKTGKVIYVQK